MAIDRDTSQHWRATPLALSLLAMLSGGAQAEAVRLRPQISVGVMALSARGDTNSDRSQIQTINVNPSVNVQLMGPRLQITGNVGVEAVARSDASSQTTARPRGGLLVRVIPIPNALDIELSAQAERVGANPYAARPEGLAGENEATSLRYRVAPTYTQPLSADVTLMTRAEQAWNRVVDVPNSPAAPLGSDASEQEIRLDRAPKPFGWTLEAIRQQSRLTRASQDTMELQAARAVTTFSLTDQLVLGISLGREHVQYAPIDRVDTLYGIRARWLPTERTEVKASAENRFFGTGYKLEARHRTPYLGLAIQAHREPLIQAGRTMRDPNLTNLSSILGNILTTRNPDALSRETAVRGIVNSLGLSQPLARAVDLNATHAQLHTGASGTAAFLGRNNLLSVTAYIQRQQRLQDALDLLDATGLNGDMEQQGFEIGYQHRLSARLSFDAGIRLGRARGLGLDVGSFSNDRSMRLGAVYQLAPSTTLYLALRHQHLDSNITVPLNETSLSANLSQRF
jgi:uncharacterized protein (PEP-CTERM system associated)